MAYLAFLWKARTIEKYRLKYEKEKMNSILAANKELPKSTFYQKITVYRNDSQKRFQRIYRNWFPEGSKVDNICTCLRENRDFVLKIVIGFVGGIVSTYFWYKVFVFEFAVWTVISWIVAVAITLGIAFSLRVRCLVLLLIPGLFSRVGRYTLACYALVLILTGPATNTLKNLDTLSDSLACGQEQIKSSVKQITESKDNPLNLVKETMSGTIERIQQLAYKMKELMVKIHRLTMSLAHVLQSSLYWLNSVEVTCNTKLGTPFEHCTKVVAPGIKSCEEQFPEYSRGWDWNVIVQALCLTVNLIPVDSICVAGDFTKASIVATVKKKLNTFSSRLQSLLNVGVHIRRSHTCCSNGSLPVSQAAAGIVTDLRNRADPLLTWLSWSCTLTGLFLLLIIFRAKYYQHMFRTRSRFDNRYVTTELRELDLKRQRQGRETVLPLNTRERAKYVSTASIRLLPSERLYLTRSIVFMVITTFKLMIHMVADYSLYWVLMNIRFHGSAPTSFRQTDRMASILVSGSGPLAAIVRMLIESLSVPLVRPAPSTNSCLPNPNPPDLQRYAQIGSLILLLWLLALFEPYGLRLRHVITGRYQPERAKARAIWLYYHIIRTRSCFLKYARRKLHRQYKYTSEEKLTFKKWLNKYIPWRCLRCLLRLEPEEPHCLLCYTKHRQDDLDRHLKRCDTQFCPGVYCARCFMDIGQLCTICYSPEDYGDLSDVSLEKFTSDDSESDDNGDNDDDHKGDMKTLMETADHEFEEDDNATHSKLAKKNQRNMLLLLKDKNNEELKPLLECDYLNKAYNQQQKLLLNCDTDYKCNLQTQTQLFTRRIETELKNNYLHINEKKFNKELQTDKSLLSSDKKLSFTTSSSAEITVKGVNIPKGKLGAVVKTMMLLTTKVNDEEYDKCKNNDKHQPFEYLVMEMFQPLEIVKRIIQMRNIRCPNSLTHFRIGETDASFKKDIPFLYTNSIIHTEKLKNEMAPVGKDLPKIISNVVFESVPRYLQSNFQENKKYEQLVKRNRNMCSNKRNVKRYLEIRKVITDDVIKRLRKRNINCNKNKLNCRRRRRRNKSYLYSRIIEKVSNVFSNKAIKNGQLNVAHAKNKQAIETPLEINKQEKYVQYNADNKIDVTQETEYCIKKHTDSYSNNATAGTVDIKSVKGATNRSTSKKNDKTGGVELEKKCDRKIVELEIRETTPKKLGFWTRLFLSKVEHSPRTFTTCAKDEPLSSSSFMNRKKRKKVLVHDRTKVVNTAHLKPSKVYDDARSYRISLYLKDRDWYSKIAKYNTILDFRKDDTLVGLDSKTSKRLAKEKERQKKEEIKNIKREEKLKRSNEAKLKKAARKAKPAKEKRTDKKNRRRAGGEGDELNEVNNEIKPRPLPADSSLMKRLKSITQISLQHSKHQVKTFSGVGVRFSDYCNEVKKTIDFPEDGDEVKNENSTGENQTEQTSSTELSPFHCKTISSNSNDGTIRQERIENLQNLECQIKSFEYKQSEVTVGIEDESVEGQRDRDVQTAGSEPLKSISSCSHIWHVEPKKQVKCQTSVACGRNDGQLYQDRTLSRQNMLHTTSGCFQVGIKSEIKVIKDTKTSSESLKNSKRTQLTTIYNTFKKMMVDPKSGVDKEVTAYPELVSRGNQYEAVWQMDKQTQVHQNHSWQHVETQCLPSIVLCPLQNSAIETEKTETRACATQCRPVYSYREEFTKELTGSLAPPYATIEYTDEKPLKEKRTRIKDVATSHQSTTTDTKTLADVSTTTDWWSPILERKEMKRKQGAIIIQENPSGNKCRETVPGVTLSMKPQCPQFLPSETGDILSPSRYLFQSEYYNQIYCMEQGSPIGSSRRLQRYYDDLERPLKLCHKLRKGPKTKRLEECYSPRKKMQSSTLNLVPPKWRPAEEQTHALKYYKRRSSKNSSQKSRKVRHDKELFRNMQSNLWAASTVSSGYIH